MTKLQAVNAFREICRDYFPRWNRNGGWQLKLGNAQELRGNSGYCDSKAKRVYISASNLTMADYGLRSFIIHEICHDVGGATHGRPWLARMRKAAEQAERLGDTELAAMLRTEMMSYGVLRQ